MAKDTGKKLADMLYGANPDQAAFGVYPQLKPKRSKQDPEAAKNVPVDLARGFVSGVAGAPGDLESMFRLLPGLDESRTILPTSEDIEKRLPFKSDTPVSRAATGLGQLGGGFYTGPGSPFRLVGAIPGALKHGAEEFAKASAGSASNVVKPKGGNWTRNTVESLVGELKRNPTAAASLEEMKRVYPPEVLEFMSPETRAQVDRAFPHLEQQVALNKWVDSNLTNYIKKDMATPDDVVRKLAEQGIVHIPSEQVGVNRYKAPERRAIMGGEQLAQSPEAQAWENATDVVVRSDRVGDLLDLQKKSTIHDGYVEPWMVNADPNTKVYTVNSWGSNLGFDHILDVLREDLASGRIRPEQLNKVSMEQAVRRTYEYDQELAAKMAQARAAQRADLPVYKEYPEGYRWIELNKPGAFASESEAMGHSVRGYEPPQGHPDWIEGSGDRGSLGYGHGGWEAIKSGKAKVYSLVDPKGNPHVTVEVGPPQARSDYDSMQAIYDQAHQEANAANFTNTAEFNNFYHDRVKQLQMEMLDKRSAEMAPRITQIKGKQNRAPGDEYLPFVQDFVRSGQWSDVGDLHNTGMRATRDIFSDAELQKLRDLGHTDLPHIMPGEEIQRYHNMIVPEGQRLKYDAKGNIIGLEGAEGMAHGGRVHISDNPDTMALELAGGGLVKGLIKAAQAAKEAPSIIVPGTISKLQEEVAKKAGQYAAKRVQRAADEIPNLEKMYKEQALKEAFTGDNAKAVVTMNPADFEKYAHALEKRTEIGPKMAELAKQGEIDKYTVPTDEYIEHLMRLHGFDQVPYLNLFKDETGLPIIPNIVGHEGRHRSRALSEQGQPSSLVQISPRGGLREDLPRRSQEEYIEALREELGLSNNQVIPEPSGPGTGRNRDRSPIILPDVYAEGGEVHMAGGGALGALAKLARAAPKTRQEIEAIAERLAPQVTGEYVRESAKSAKTVAGKTKKQFERERDLPVDIRATKEERIPQPVDIEKLKGEVMIGIPGDPTVTGKTLYSVGEHKLGSPSPQHGGPQYGLYHDDDHFWASGLGAARRVQNLAREAAQQYDAPVAGNYIMMGPESINYAQHFADANLQAIDLSKMTKRQIEGFDKLIRQGSPASGPRPSFPGIEDKESAYLHMAMDPELRKHFNDLMQKNTVTEAFNLPSGHDIRYAITEPALRDLETGVTGYSLGRMRPDIPASELKFSEHPTYSHDIPGHFLGQSPYPMPYELSFPDTLRAIRENPKQAPHEFGSLKMVGPRQIIDQQMIDEIKAYEERMKQLTGKKRGGAVSYAEGGDITADDLILEERKL